MLIYYALTSPTRTAKVIYVAPTQGQAKDIMWDMLIELAGDLVSTTHKNDLHITLKNGVTIQLKGADRPETMKGLSIWFAVLDEFADMRPDVWEQIIRPALSDLKGRALFIGTPMGRNHFYELYVKGQLGDSPNIKSFHFTSYDNPFLDRDEIETAKKEMSRTLFQQEYMASFEMMGGQLFEEEWIRLDDEKPSNAVPLIAIDPAGFSAHAKGKGKKKLDDTAICTTYVGSDGWWDADITHGRWTLDTTSRKIFDLVMEHQPIKVGIEKGIAQQALLSPLQDLMRRYNRYFNIELLTHGNKSKTDRVMWALQGRFENGLIRLNPGDWNAHFIDQLLQFPSPLTHDDLIDALAYIDQLAQETYGDGLDLDFDDYEYTDEYAGY